MKIIKNILKQIKLWKLSKVKPIGTTLLKIKSNYSDYLFIQEYGNPNGEVFVFLHGGPGGNFDYTNLRWFDLTKHRVILFDQRGSGQSQGQFFTKENNTNNLVQDIETIRTELKLGKINLFGGSWGSCLALAYSIKFPLKVNKLFLWGLLLGNEKDIKFIPEEFLSPEEKYFCDNKFFFPYDDFLLKNCKILEDKTIYLAHGKKDNVCSYKNSEKLKEELPNVELFLGEEDYHSSSSEGIEKFLQQSIKGS